MGQGGARREAGRPSGTGKWGCPTAIVRVPAHLAKALEAFAWTLLRLESSGVKIHVVQVQEWADSIESRAMAEGEAFSGEIPS